MATDLTICEHGGQRRKCETCEAWDAARELHDALKIVIKCDATPMYEYGQPRPSDGATPERGQRWLVPREIARNALCNVGPIPASTHSSGSDGDA